MSNILRELIVPLPIDMAERWTLADPLAPPMDLEVNGGSINLQILLFLFLLFFSKYGRACPHRGRKSWINY